MNMYKRWISKGKNEVIYKNDGLLEDILMLNIPCKSQISSSTANVSDTSWKQDAQSLSEDPEFHTSHSHLRQCHWNLTILTTIPKPPSHVNYRIDIHHLKNQTPSPFLAFLIQALEEHMTA